MAIDKADFWTYYSADISATRLFVKNFGHQPTAYELSYYLACPLEHATRLINLIFA